MKCFIIQQSYLRYISLQTNVLRRKNNGRRVTTWRFTPYWITHMSPNIRQKVGRPLVFRSNWSVSLKLDMKVTSAATLINNVAVMRTPLTSLIIRCVQLLQTSPQGIFRGFGTPLKTPDCRNGSSSSGEVWKQVTGVTTQNGKPVPSATQCRNVSTRKGTRLTMILKLNCKTVFVKNPIFEPGNSSRLTVWW
jgi:hypothetical protein